MFFCKILSTRLPMCIYMFSIGTYYEQKSQMRINWIWLIMHRYDILIPLLIKTFYIGCWIVCEVDLGFSKHCHEDNMIVATRKKNGFKNIWMIWQSNFSFLILFHWGYIDWSAAFLTSDDFLRSYEITRTKWLIH